MVNIYVLNHSLDAAYSLDGLLSVWAGSFTRQFIICYMREGAKISNDMIQFITIESLAIRIFLKKKFIDRLL